MKGTNTIVMNQATLQQAIAHYLNTLMFREGVTAVVLGVDKSTRHHGGEPLCCDVDIQFLAPELEDAIANPVMLTNEAPR